MKTRMAAIFLCGLFVSVTPVFALVTDYGIKNEIAEKLDKTRLGKHDIEVVVRGHAVEITGTVSRPEDRLTIERLAVETDGVTRVENKIEVTDTTSVSLQSGKLVDDALERIRSAPGMHDWNITVTAHDSDLTLAGTVAKPEDRLAIERLVTQVDGVGKITNLITTERPASDVAITARVRDALRETPGVDLSKINIQTNDGVVVFSGSLNNHREIDKVLSVAQMVDGVKSVRSNMQIGGRAYLDSIEKNY